MSNSGRKIRRDQFKAEADKRNAQARSALRDYKKNRAVGPCFVEGCTFNGDELFECITCEKTGAKKPFKIQACPVHREMGVAKTKRHALIKHLQNIPAAAAAAITGNLGDV